MAWLLVICMNGANSKQKNKLENKGNSESSGWRSDHKVAHVYNMAESQFPNGPSLELPKTHSS